MRKVIVNEFLTLDGTAQAPGGPEEDTSGGFRHGGWHMRYGEGSRMAELIGEAGGFLLGRRTYEIFAGYWPTATDAPQDLAEPLNTKPKYVASRTLTTTEWENSTVLEGDVPEAVAALKREDGGDLHVWGSTELVATLVEHGLVDELRLLIDPVVLGGGKRFFRDDGVLRPLRLVDSMVNTKGVILATYVPAGV